MVTPVPDIKNIEHNEDAEAKKVVLIGKTTSGSYKTIKLDTDGSLI